MKSTMIYSALALGALIEIVLGVPMLSASSKFTAGNIPAAGGSLQAAVPRYRPYSSTRVNVHSPMIVPDDYQGYSYTRRIFYPAYKSAEFADVDTPALVTEDPYKCIAVFGGTGPTGLQLLKHLAKLDKEVRVVVRNKDKIPADLIEKFHVIDGGITEDTVKSALEECDVVLSTLGYLKGNSEHFMTLSIGMILDVAKDAGIKKMIVMSGGATEASYDPPLKTQPWGKKMIRKLVSNAIGKAVFDDYSAMNEMVMNAGFVVLRPPALTDGEETTQVNNADFFPMGLLRRISRSDVAWFMLQLVQDDSLYEKYRGKAPSIYHK